MFKTNAMKILKYLTFFLACLALAGCPGELEDPVKVTFRNASDVTVYIYETSELLQLPPSKAVLPGKAFSFTFEEARFNHSNFTLYVFTEATLQNNDWDYLKENNLYDAKFNHTLQELRDLNYTVLYTGE